MTRYEAWPITARRSSARGRGAAAAGRADRRRASRACAATGALSGRGGDRAVPRQQPVDRRRVVRQQRVLRRRRTRSARASARRLASRCARARIASRARALVWSRLRGARADRARVRALAATARRSDSLVCSPLAAARAAAGTRTCRGIPFRDSLRRAARRGRGGRLAGAGIGLLAAPAATRRRSRWWSALAHLRRHTRSTRTAPLIVEVAARRGQPRRTAAR